MAPLGDASVPRCLSDLYRRFDFIDAVLEEGAMPTVPLWCDMASALGDHDMDPDEGSSSSSSSNPAARSRVPATSTDAASTDSDDETTASTPAVGTATPGSVGSPAPATSPPSLPLTASSDVGRSRSGSEVPAWTLYDGEVGELEATARRDFASAMATTASTALPSHALLGLHPPARWRLQQGQCTGVLKLIIEACLNRYGVPV